MFNRFMIGCAVLLSGLLALSARAETQLDKVKDGVIVVYDVRDLMVAANQPSYPEGEKPPSDEIMMKQIVALVQDTISHEEWIDNGGKTAAMVISPHAMSIKGSPKTHEQVSMLLRMLREPRKFGVRASYRVVENKTFVTNCDQTSEGWATAWLDEKLEAALKKDAREIVAPSELELANGHSGTLLERVSDTLPDVLVESTVSADRKWATITLRMTDRTSGKSQRHSFSVQSGKSVAASLDEAHTLWLVISPEVRMTRGYEVIDKRPFIGEWRADPLPKDVTKMVFRLKENGAWERDIEFTHHSPVNEVGKWDVESLTCAWGEPEGGDTLHRKYFDLLDANHIMYHSDQSDVKLVRVESEKK